MVHWRGLGVAGAVSGAMWLGLLAAGYAAGAAVKEVEPNGDFDTAQKVATNCDVQATMGEGGDSDFFRLQVQNPTFLRASATGVPAVDVGLVLYAEDGEEIARVDGQRAGKPEQMLHRVRRGTYLLEVKLVAEEGARAGAPYTLQLRETTLVQYEPSMAQIKAAIKKGLLWLAPKQKAEGCWEPKSGHYGVSGLALMGFIGEKLPEFDKTIARGMDFFTKAYVPPGTHKDDANLEDAIAGSLIGDGPNSHFIYEHAIATLALAEYVHAHPKDAKARAMLTGAAGLLVRCQATEAKPQSIAGPVAAEAEYHGSWRYQANADNGDLSASGWALIALAAAETAGYKLPENVRKDYMGYCRRCFNEERGAYAYQVKSEEVTNTTNAVGVLTTLMCVGGKCPVVRKGIATLRKSFPAWEQEGGRGLYPFYYWYYASRAMYVAGGNYWKEWQGAICPMLLERQNADGSWDAAQKEEEVGTEYTTALAILILQLCSGNPPAYLEGLTLETVKYDCPQCLDDIQKLLKAAKGDDTTKEQLIKQVQELINRYYGD